MEEAMAATAIAPIGTRQINRELYVGQGDLITIQAAVNVAVKIGGSFTIVVPAAYGGSDTVAGVTGANAQVLILDMRAAQWQSYTWNGTAYVPATFQQASGFISLGPPASFADGSAAFYFYPAGTNGVGTAHLDFYANPGKAGMPALNIVGVPSDGSPLWTFIRCDQDALLNPRIQVPSAMEVYTPSGVNNYNIWAGMNRDIAGAKGMSIWGRPTDDAIDLQGETLQDDTTTGLYNQAIRLNMLGGDVQVGPVLIDEAGNIVGAMSLDVDGSITADSAEFNTCLVDNSPVRTFANTGDTPAGMIWPPIGIAVSAGSTWGTSISPASLATWPHAGIPVSTGTAWGTSISPASLATYPPAGIAVSTGTAWGASISPASLATYPPAGIAVSTGTAWGAAIAAANVAMLNQANNFAQMNSFTLNASGGITIGSTGGLTIAWNIGNGVGETDFINSRASVGGGFRWYNVAPNTTVTSATVAAMTLDSNGNLVVPGTVSIASGLIASGWGTNNTANSIHIGSSASINYFDSLGPNTTTPASTQFRAISSNSSVVNLLLTLGPTGVTANAPFVAALGTNLNSGLSVTGAGGARANSFSFGINAGVCYLDFCGNNTTTNGNAWVRCTSSDSSISSYVMQFNPTLITLNQNTNVAGTFYASGTIGSGGAKSFRIPHPLDETKDLVHACIEGPEAGVYYRGESVTESGWATITLPDYFEALTMQENRTVLLTALFEDDAEQIGMLAAGRVKEGKFKVWSGLPAQKFYWEVKAVRADIAPLEVTQPKMEPLATPPSDFEPSTQPTGGQE
jgi:hypothetical protein